MCPGEGGEDRACGTGKVPPRSPPGGACCRALLRNHLSGTMVYTIPEISTQCSSSMFLANHNPQTRQQPAAIGWTCALGSVRFLHDSVATSAVHAVYRTGSPVGSIHDPKAGSVHSVCLLTVPVSASIRHAKPNALGCCRCGLWVCILSVRLFSFHFCSSCIPTSCHS